MESGTAQHNIRVHLQDSSIECREYVPLQPDPQHPALFRVAPFQTKYPNLDLKKTDYGQILIRSGNRSSPRLHIVICSRALAEFGYYIRIEKVHGGLGYEKFAARGNSSPIRAGSNGISAASGIASRSAILLESSAIFR